MFSRTIRRGLTLGLLSGLVGCGLGVGFVPGPPAAQGPSNSPDDAGAEPSALSAYLQSTSHLVDGGETDLDGDGTPDLSTTFDGGYRITVPISGRGVTVITAPNGDQWLSDDADGDGTPEITWSIRRTGSQVQSVWTTPLDGAGKVRRLTVVQDEAQGLAEHLSELGQVQDGGGVLYQVEGTAVGALNGPEAEDLQLPDGGCNPMAGFPDRPGTPVDGASFITVVEGDDPGACPQAVADAIRETIHQHLAGWSKCLEGRNPLLATALALAPQTRTLRIGCGGQCADKSGATDIFPPGTFPSHLPRMNLNLTAKDQPTDPDPFLSDPTNLEDTLLHELLHWAGAPHAPDETGDGFRDPIYACGRLCGGCGQGPVPLAGYPDDEDSDAFNCAACSTVERKMGCGWRGAVVPMGACVEGWCTPDDAQHEGGLGSDCYNTAAVYCDGSLVGPPGLVGECPGTCPTGTHSMCQGWDPNSLPNSCNDRPKECDR